MDAIYLMRQPWKNIEKRKKNHKNFIELEKVYRSIKDETNISENQFP